MIEDGHEYIELCARFGAHLATWSRVGSGAEALKAVRCGEADALLLDVCFRRLPNTYWLDPLPGQERWVRNVGAEQGLVILQHLRGLSPTLPVVLAMDPARDPLRWQTIEARYAPVAPLGARLQPSSVVASLESMIPVTP